MKSIVSLILTLLALIIISSCMKQIELSEDDLILLVNDPEALIDFTEKWELRTTVDDVYTTLFSSPSNDVHILISKGQGYTLVIRGKEWKDLNKIRASWDSKYKKQVLTDPSLYQEFIDTLQVHSVDYYSNDTLDILFAESISEENKIYLLSISKLDLDDYKD